MISQDKAKAPIGVKQINTAKSLEQILFRAAIPHARTLSRWVFERLIPSYHPGTPHWVLKDEVEIETGITFQGRTFSNFIALLVKKNILAMASDDQKGQYRLGTAGRCISQRVALLEEQMRTVQKDNAERDAKIDRILQVVLEKIDPPYTPERAARWLAENVDAKTISHSEDDEFPG